MCHLLHFMTILASRLSCNLLVVLTVSFTLFGSHAHAQLVWKAGGSGTFTCDPGTAARGPRYFVPVVSEIR